MTHTLLIKALAGTAASGGMVRLVLSSEQLETLKRDINSIPSTFNDEMILARSIFLEKEGYMASDSTCWKYWNKHKESL